MGFRFRKSVKIAPGLKLNFSKSGVSTSIGGPGHTINISNSGTRATFGIPGTGISYSQNLSSRRRPSTRRRGAIGTYSREGGYNCEAGYITPEAIAAAQNRRWCEKYRALAWCASIFGIFGAHRYYAGKIWSGLLYTFTCGLFFIGWIIDFVRIITGSFRDADGAPLVTSKSMESLPFIQGLPERRFSIQRAILYILFFALLCVFVHDRLPVLLGLNIDADKNIFVYSLVPTFFSCLYLFCWRRI